MMAKKILYRKDKLNVKETIQRQKKERMDDMTTKKNVTIFFV